MKSQTAQMLDLVVVERIRQRELLAHDPARHDCASPSTDDDEVLRVLVEEVGEVAVAIDLVKRSLRKYEPAPCFLICLEHLREELVQVAAVAVAGAERATAIMEIVDESIAAKEADAVETAAVPQTV